MKHTRSPLTQVQINHLVGLYSNGKLQEALMEATRLAEMYPQIAPLHNIQGACYDALGQAENAAESFRRTLRIKPDFAQAHYNLGNTLSVLGQLHAAVESYRRALDTNPDYAEAHNGLGKSLWALGQMDAALACFERALEIKPDFAEVHNNLGSVLKDLDRPHAAMASYKRALEFKPDFAEAHNNLGNTLSDLGHLDDSVASFERALEIRPDYAGAHRNLSGLKTYQPGDAQITLMERLYSRPETDKSESKHLCFGLAKAYDDLGEVDKSFDYLAEGNLLRKKELGYDIDSDRRLFAIIKGLFGAESPSIDAVPIDEPSSIQPIFIVGMPRSGTSLVEQILASHSQVHGAGELGAMENFLTPFFLQSAGQLTGQQSNPVSRDDISALRETYLKGLAALQVTEVKITDKMPLNFRWVGFIMCAFPKAKIINLNRDPVATCWSNYKYYFPSTGIGYAYDLEDLSSFYKLYTDLMSFWHERFPNKIYDLCYEDLTEHQQEETRKLLAYCDLDWEDSCLSFHETKRVVKTASAGQVRQKIYTGSSEAWKKYETHLQPLIKSLG